MIRATTGSVLKSYRSNLMNSFISMNKAQNTMLTQRNFNSYAEDPAGAAKAFKLRKSRMTVQSQYSICDDTYKKHQTAWSCLDTVSKLIDTKNGEPMSTLSGTTLEMLDDPKGDARTQLNKVLDQLSQTIVQTMNQKYGDNFIFAGADGHNVPFDESDIGCRDGSVYYFPLLQKSHFAVSFLFEYWFAQPPLKAWPLQSGHAFFVLLCRISQKWYACSPPLKI